MARRTPREQPAAPVVPPPRVTSPLPSLRWSACALLGGAATLAAEVMGARMLRATLGSTSIAQTATVSGVLLGLGVGAHLAGRAFVRGTVTPRRWLVFSHALLALFAALAPFAAHAFAEPIARVLLRADAVSPLAGDLLRALAGVACTALPGALAGSAFPALVRVGAWRAGFGTAWVGAMNSLGAAAGASLTTFALAPEVGVTWCVRGAAMVFAAVACIAALPEGESPATSAEPTVSPRVTRTGRPFAALVLVGLASTTWQLCLARLGVLAFGPSAFALTVALAAHVLSLAVGECWAAWRMGRPGRPGVDLDGVLRVAAFGAALAMPVALALPRMSARLLAGGAPSNATLWSAAMACVFAAAVPVVAFVGAAMATGAQALEAAGRERGQANAAVLLATSLGNVAGAWAVAFGALPWLRIEGALAFAVAALVGAAAFAASEPSSLLRGRRAVLTVATVLVAAWTTRDARRTPGGLLGGPFLYAGNGAIELGRVRWRRDGREATVAVRDDDTGAVLLQIDGKVDATSEGDATTQTIVGIVPTAMAARAERALVVGMGSGMTADAVRSVPGVRSVTVLELVPEVVDAARVDFARANDHLLADPRVHARAADAAQWLHGTADTYDVIVSEPSNPWVAGMSELFTVEFFRAARDRLRAGGVLGAWFHAYSTDGETVASVVETFRTVFPRAAMLEVSAGQDYLLVGVKEPYDLDLDAFFARVEAPQAARRAERAGLESRGAWLARFVAGPSGLRAIGAGAEVLSSQDLVLEFRAPALLYRDATADIFERFARVQDLPLAGLVSDTSPRSTWMQLVDSSEPLREARTHLRAMVLAEREGSLDRAIVEGELATGLFLGDTLQRTQVARLYLQRAAQRRLLRDPGAAEADLTAALELHPYATERFRALVSLGDLANRRRDGARAWARFTEALDVAQAAGQAAPELRVRRAEALAILGAREDAARELERAIAETPDPDRREALRRVLRGQR